MFDLDFIRGLVRIASVTGFTVVAGFIMISIYPLEIKNKGFFELGSKVALIALVTLAVHIGVSSLFDLDEVKPVLSRLKRLILRPVKWQV